MFTLIYNKPTIEKNYGQDLKEILEKDPIKTIISSINSYIKTRDQSIYESLKNFVSKDYETFIAYVLLGDKLERGSIFFQEVINFHTWCINNEDSNYYRYYKKIVARDPKCEEMIKTSSLSKVLEEYPRMDINDKQISIFC